MSMTDIIVIIIAVVFILVLLDGLRSKWKARRNRVRMKLEKSLPPADDDDDLLLVKSELPNGGARSLPRDGRPARPESAPAKTAARDVPVLMDTVELEEEYIEHTNVYADSRLDDDADDYDRNDEDADDDDDDEYIDGLDEDFIDDAGPVRVRSRNPDEDEWDDDDEDEDDDDDEDWDDDEDFDDDSEEDDDDDEESDEESDEDDWDDDDDDEDDREELLKPREYSEYDEYEDEDDETDSDYDEYGDYEDFDEPEAAHLSGSSTRHSNDRIEPGFGDEELQSYELDEDFGSAYADENEHRQAVQKERKRKSVFTAGFLSRKDQGELFRDDFSSDAEPEEEAEPSAAPEEVIVINVMARPGELFEGFDLLPVLQLQGLRLGDMSIFHKYSGSNGSGSVLFSMANMVKPGTFDLGSMETFSTPGISFFLQMPNKKGNMHCFDQMLAAATAVKNSLDGELKDENRSVFTRQTLEHYRQRIQDFELRMLSRK